MKTKNENMERSKLTRRVLTEKFKKVLHVYTRTAVDNITGDSIRLQKTLGEDKAICLGLNPKYYDDGAVAGNGEEINQRPALVNLLEDVADDRVKCIYVRDISRLSRSAVALNEILEILKDRQVTIYTERGIYYENTEFINDIRVLFEQHHRENHSRKIKAGLAMRRVKQTENN